MYNKYNKVIIKSCNLKGTIIKIIKKKKKTIYQVILNNNFITYVEEKDILCTNNIEENTYINAKHKNNKISYELNEKKEDFIPEIMLRHQTLDEAIQNLDYFINQAISLNIKKVKIIHGKNGGILRNGVHNYLKSNNYIKDFYLGEYFEGSYGVTIAILK